MEKIILNRRNLLVIIVFLISFFQTSSGNATEYNIEITHYTKQLILDSVFDKNPGDSPWYSAKEGDISDIEANLGGSAVNYEIIGNQRTFTLVNCSPHVSDWRACSNPNFPVLPDVYEINSSGFYVSHIWNETVNQTRNMPSVRWERDINMPVNISDYKITSADITAVFNATVEDLVLNRTKYEWVANNSGIEDNGGIEVPGDAIIGPFNVDKDEWSNGDFANGDFAKFYVLLSDLGNNKEYRIAFNQTTDLGQDIPAITNITDKVMTSVDEDTLIFYLTSVLENNHHNFTISVGMDIYCEDNVWAGDVDYWKSLIIKSVNLTFTYEKKIDLYTSLSWNQIGNAIRKSDYQSPNSTVELDIDNATLIFDYKINKAWPSSLSPNSEIRIYINDVSHSETIKLAESSTVWKKAAGDDGFDVTELIQKEKNITLSLKLYLADNFELSDNISISIDNVYLTTTYTVTVTTALEPLFDWSPVIVALITTIIAIFVILGLYHSHFKFPPMIRDIRRTKRRIKRGKGAPPVKTQSREDITRDIWNKLISNSKVKGTKITKETRTKEELKDVIKSHDVTEESESVMEEILSENEEVKELIEKENVEKVQFEKTE
ncbi:MAG: hypothetical protein ACTSWY_10050 [Promethearchaeota archaeon]